MHGHLGAGMQFQLRVLLPDDSGSPQILQNHRIDPAAGTNVQTFQQLGQLVFFDQSVYRRINLFAPRMGKTDKFV